MVQFCVTIADADVDRVITAMCANYGYQPNIQNINFSPDQPVDSESNPEYVSNPETAGELSNRMTRDFLMNNTVAYEVKLQKENITQPMAPDISNPQE
jgi:hypothetical protein